MTHENCGGTLHLIPAPRWAVWRTIHVRCDRCNRSGELAR